MFHVGQFVMHLSGETYGTDWDGFIVPEVGKIYTIRAMEKHWYSDELAIRVEEIVNPTLFWVDLGRSMEPHFYAKRFRPLLDSRLDIFRAMLAPSDKDVVPCWALSEKDALL